MFCCTSRYTHNTFSMFKTWKTVFLCINVFLPDSPLIKSPRLLMLDIFVSLRPIILTPFPFIWHCEEYVFQNVGVPCNYRVREEETKRQTFGLLCRVGRLLAVSVSLMVVCSRLLVVCGSLLSFTCGLW